MRPPRGFPGIVQKKTNVTEKNPLACQNESCYLIGASFQWNLRKEIDSMRLKSILLPGLLATAFALAANPLSLPEYEREVKLVFPEKK